MHARWLFRNPLGPGPAASWSRAQHRDACLVVTVIRRFGSVACALARASFNLCCSSGLKGSVLNRLAIFSSVSGPGGTCGPPHKIWHAPLSLPLRLFCAAACKAASLSSAGSAAGSLVSTRLGISRVALTSARHSSTNPCHSPTTARCNRSRIAEATFPASTCSPLSVLAIDSPSTGLNKSWALARSNL